MAGVGDRAFQAADDETAHQTRIAKAHFGLCGMDVDVNLARIAFEIERERGVAARRQEIDIGAAHRAREQLVAHRPAVDEDILHGRGRAMPGREPGESGQPHVLALGLDEQRIVDEVAPKHLSDAIGKALRVVVGRAKGERRQMIAGQREGDVVMGERDAAHDVGDGLRLGARGLQELETRRRRGEEIAHLDARAARPGRGLHGAFGARLNANGMSDVRALFARVDRQLRHGADRGQGFSTKAERRDIGEIAVGQF